MLIEAITPACTMPVLAGSSCTFILLEILHSIPILADVLHTLNPAVCQMYLLLAVKILLLALRMLATVSVGVFEEYHILHVKPMDSSLNTCHTSDAKSIRPTKAALPEYIVSGKYLR